MRAAQLVADFQRTTPDVVVEVWNAMPPVQRHLAGLNTRLTELGYSRISRATMYRWLKDNKLPEIPDGIVAQAAKVVAPAPTPLTVGKPIDLEGIPEPLIEALGLRVLVIAKGHGLDRVEDAVVKVSMAIAGKAEEIAAALLETESESETVEKGGETVKSTRRADAASAAMNAVNALSKLADAMHRITASRVLWSVGHRNFAESDRLSGEGEKYRAEAETTRLAARADNARTINQPTVEGAAQGFDPDADDEALTAMRDVESRK